MDRYFTNQHVPSPSRRPVLDKAKMSEMEATGLAPGLIGQICSSVVECTAGRRGKRQCYFQTGGDKPVYSSGCFSGTRSPKYR